MSAERRRRLLVGCRLQVRYIVAIIASQLLLVGAAIAVLHVEYAAILDAHLYRVHPDAGALADALLGALGRVLGGAVLADLALFGAIHALWARRVGLRLREFRAGLAALGGADYRAPPVPAQPDDLLDRLYAWRLSEHTRQAALRDVLAGIGDRPRGEQLAALAAARRLLVAGW